MLQVFAIGRGNTTGKVSCAPQVAHSEIKSKHITNFARELKRHHCHAPHRPTLCCIYVAFTQAPHSTPSPQPQHRPRFENLSHPLPTLLHQQSLQSALLLLGKPIQRTEPATFMPGQLAASSVASFPVFGLGATQRPVMAMLLVWVLEHLR